MRLHLITLIKVLLISNFSFTQNSYEINTIAFYNLENLFDPIDDTLKLDEESPIMKLRENRKIIYNHKLSNMAKVIAEIGVTEKIGSPDIIGIAEIENRTVLEDLINTSPLNQFDYGIIHYDSPDIRGIDVGLIYRKSSFIPVHHRAYELKLWDETGQRNYTRDQLLVSGYLNNEKIHIIINHWPSRRGGQVKSNFKREKAAYLTTVITSEIYQLDSLAKIIIMGDLNDDPHNSSLKNILKTKKHARDTKDGEFYNPYELLFKKGGNTLAYGDNINLFDQIIVNGQLISKNKKYNGYSFLKAGIFNPPYLTTSTGKYKGYPFRSFSTSGFTGGYSDHYPVYIYLVRRVP